RYKTAKKRNRNQQWRMRQADRKKENCCQYRVDQRDHDLRTHNRGEAPIEIAESCRNLIAANGVEIVLHAMSAAVRVEACFDKQAPGCDNCKHTESQHRGRASGKISYVSQVIRFLSKRVDDHLSEAFKISEWQVDLALLRP